MSVWAPQWSELRSKAVQFRAQAADSGQAAKAKALEEALMARKVAEEAKVAEHEALSEMRRGHGASDVVYALWKKSKPAVRGFFFWGGRRTGRSALITHSGSLARSRSAALPQTASHTWPSPWSAGARQLTEKQAQDLAVKAAAAKKAVEEAQAATRYTLNMGPNSEYGPGWCLRLKGNVMCPRISGGFWQP